MCKRKKDFRVKLKNFTVILLKEFHIADITIKLLYCIVLYYRLHVSTYIQVIFGLSFTGEYIKCYACWNPIMLTEIKYIKT